MESGKEGWLGDKSYKIKKIIIIKIKRGSKSLSEETVKIPASKLSPRYTLNFTSCKTLPRTSFS